jgi:hypothetical protein
VMVAMQPMTATAGGVISSHGQRWRYQGGASAACRLELMRVSSCRSVSSLLVASLLVASLLVASLLVASLLVASLSVA